MPSCSESPGQGPTGPVSRTGLWSMAIGKRRRANLRRHVSQVIFSCGA